MFIIIIINKIYSCFINEARYRELGCYGVLHAKIIQTVIRYNVHIIKIFIKKNIL